jgi:NAD(P)-dependent dehydrogenase (short-subunit alcohol dehydrogenase family)
MSGPVTGSLEGKVVLVTGGGTGIGRAVCLMAAQNGGDVVIGYHASEAEARRVEKEIRTMGRHAVAIKADLGSPREARSLVAQAVDAMGAIHVLVNNAAIVRRAAFLEFTEADWDETLAVNLRGTFLCTQEAARAMVRLGIRGRIVNISSVGGMLAHADLCAYDASKAAIDMLTRSAAFALGSHGIAVNAVSPGAIEVERNRDEFEGEQGAARWRNIIPFGRWGRPEDIARAVLFLAADETQFLTGQVLVVDGGQTIALASP